MAFERNLFQGPKDGWRPPTGSLAGHLLQRLLAFGDRILLEYPIDDVKLTASHLVLRCKQLATALQDIGVESGDIVSFCCSNTPDFPPLMLATLCIGATCAPLNPNNDRGDMEQLLFNLQPRVVFSTKESFIFLQQLLLKMKSTAKLLHIGDSFTKTATSKEFQITEIQDPGNHDAFIMCSSGTTGLPKGVQLSHSNFHAFLHILNRKDSSVKGTDTALIVSPVFWITGVLFHLIPMYLGTRVVILPGFQEDVYLNTIEKYKITSLIAGSNSMVALAKYRDVNKYDISSLEYVCCGGGPMSKGMQLFVEDVLKVRLSQWYGMTEMLITNGVMKTKKNKPGSVGLLAPHMCCKILDLETGQPLGINKSGELCFKGPFITKGYLKNETATRDTIDKEGWLHTGDVGYCDEDGIFFVVDRIKEIIKYQGNHIAPVEIEAVLVSHPSVKEAVVIGIPSDLDQEHLRAYIVKQTGAAVTEQELINLVSDTMAPHKWLRGGVCFVDSIPKSATGKYKRNELKSLSIGHSNA